MTKQQCSHGVAGDVDCDGCAADEVNGWKGQPWFIFDLETTGLDVDNDRVVQLGGVWMRNGDMTARHLVTINPGIPIPDEASRIHGVTNERVSHAPSFADVFQALLNHFRRAEVVVTYNGSRFDWPMLVAEAKRIGRESDLHDATVETLFVDSLVNIKRRAIGWYWKGRGRHKLTSVAHRFEIPMLPGMRLHRADADAYLTGRILWHTRSALPHVGVDARKLLEVKAEEQEADYRDWKARQGSTQTQETT